MDERLTTLAPKEAIARAKAAISDLFGDEAIAGIRLEEIRFDDRHDRWLITIGFDRLGAAGERQVLVDFLSKARTFKVVSIKDQTGEVISVTNWAAERE